MNGLFELTNLHVVVKCEISAIGPVPSPFDCYLANRGLKTLHLRMRQHQVNAMAVARFLEKNPRVQKVVYPGKLIMSGLTGSVGALNMNMNMNMKWCKVVQDDLSQGGDSGWLSGYQPEIHREYCCNSRCGKSQKHLQYV